MDFSTLRITLGRFLYQFVSTFVISVINVNKFEGASVTFEKKRERVAAKKAKS